TAVAWPAPKGTVFITAVDVATISSIRVKLTAGSDGGRRAVQNNAMHGSTAAFATTATTTHDGRAASTAFAAARQSIPRAQTTTKAVATAHAATAAVRRRAGVHSRITPRSCLPALAFSRSARLDAN